MLPANAILTNKLVHVNSSISINIAQIKNSFNLQISQTIMNYPEFCTLAKSDRIVDSYTGKIITFNLKDRY